MVVIVIPALDTTHQTLLNLERTLVSGGAREPSGLLLWVFPSRLLSLGLMCLSPVRDRAWLPGLW
jgi:hypothetical protein